MDHLATLDVGKGHILNYLRYTVEITFFNIMLNGSTRDLGLPFLPWRG